MMTLVEPKWYEIPGRILSEEDLREFYEGLEPIRESGDWDAHLAYVLHYLDDIKLGMKGPVDEPRQLAMAAIVRTCLADDLRRKRDDRGAEAELRKAVEEALDSGYHDAIHSSLHSLGTFMSGIGDKDAGAHYLQRALPYAWQVWPVFYLSTLQFLAYAWSRPETIDKAILMFDWMLLIEPKNISTLMDKYEALTRNGRAAAVEAVATGHIGTTCDSAALIVAANWARKKYRKAEDAARTGLDLSVNLNDKKWVDQFTGVLNRTTAQRGVKRKPLPSSTC